MRCHALICWTADGGSEESNMRAAPASPRHLGEQRRYFPDWTDCLPSRFPELESDHNSYLAGGYAEEFGYRALPGFSSGIPVLDEEDPEISPERYAQARATHPGYPLKPCPLAGELGGVVCDWDSAPVRSDARANPWTRESTDIDRRGGVIAVSNQSNMRKRNGVARHMALAALRLEYAVVLLRWMLSGWRPAQDTPAFPEPPRNGP
jgi:hypothetical protein